MSDVDKLQEAEEWAGQQEQEAAKEAASKQAAELAEEPVEPTATRPRSVAMIDLDQIHIVDPVRLAPVKIHELALSVRQRGLTQAITVRPDAAEADRYLVVTGHRRIEALRELSVQSDDPIQVPCLVIEDLEEAEIFALILTENEQREPLEQLSAARAARHLLDLKPDLTAKDLARSLGIKTATLQGWFRLLDLPEDVQQLLEQGDLSFTVAKMLRRAQEKGRIDESQTSNLARQVSEGAMTATAVRAQVAPPKHTGIESTQAPRTISAEELAASAGGGASERTGSGLVINGEAKVIGDATIPFDADGNLKKDKWDRTMFEADEARAAQARSDYLESEAGRLLSENPIAMSGSLPNSQQRVPLKASESHSEAEGSEAGMITPFKDQLHAKMVGRMLHDWADDTYFTELGIERDDAMTYAHGLSFSDRDRLFYHLAALVAGSSS